MTKMAEDAIERVRELSEAQQDKAAEMLLLVASRSASLVRLDDQTRAAILEGRAQARRRDFVSDDDMAAFFIRHGVKHRSA